MTSEPAAVVTLQDHPDFHDAVPTSEHFIPLLYLAGLADAAGTTADVLTDGYAYGALSMTAYTLGGAGTSQPPAKAIAAPLPSPDVVPADDTNA